MSARILMMTSLGLFALGCRGSEQGIVLSEQPGLQEDTGTGSDGDTGEEEVEEPDYSEFDGASLVVISPESGDILDLGEDADFEAEIIGADGEPLDFDGVVWTSTLDDDWNGSGLDFKDDQLIAGVHDLVVTAALPNGDRLVNTIGYVRVLHPDAGIYFGDLFVDTTIDYNGTSYTTTCIGAATLIIDAEGETATGESTCTISLLGYDLEAGHLFDFENDDGDLSGTTAIDFAIGSFDFDIEGEVDDGDLSATWSDDVYGYAQIAGELDLVRVSRETELE